MLTDKLASVGGGSATRNGLGIELLEQRDCWELIKFKGPDWKNYTTIKFSLRPSSASVQVLKTSKQDSCQWASAARVWKSSAVVKVETLEGGLTTDCTLKNEQRSRLLNEKRCEDGCCYVLNVQVLRVTSRMASEGCKSIGSCRSKWCSISKLKGIVHPNLNCHLVRDIFLILHNHFWIAQKMVSIQCNRLWPRTRL